MGRLILALLLLVPLAARAQTWPNQCPTGTQPSSVGCQPQAATPVETDLLLGWQIGTAVPHTRAMQVGQILSSGLPASFSTLTVANPIIGPGVTANFASPPPIGNILPNSGAFTSLVVNGTITLPNATGITAGAGQNEKLTTGGAGNYWGVFGTGGDAVAFAQSNTGGNVVDGSTGNTFNVTNTINAGLFHSSISTYTLSGSALIQPLRIASNYTGASTDATPSMASISNSRDAINAFGSSQGYHVLNVTANIGDGGGLTGTAGTHGALLASINQNGPVNSNGATLFLGAANIWFTGGGAITGGDFGNGFALNPQMILTNTASGYGLIETIEGTIQSDMPVNTLTTRGFLGAFSGGTNKGTVNDYAFGIFKNPGAVGFGMALQLARNGAPWGMDAAGSIIGTVIQTNSTGAVPQVVGYGVNLPTVNFATAAWWTPGFQLLGDGTQRVATGVMGPITLGVAIDVLNYVGSAPTISNSGSGYAVNDQVYDTNGGILQIDTVSGSGQITAFHYLRVPYSYGGAGAATMALRGGTSGTQTAVVGVTWTQRTQLSLQPSGGATLVGGTLAITGAVSGAGITALFAAPGPIGSVTPSTGAFTTLSASGAVTGAGFTALFASPPAIGSTTQASGAFTSVTLGGLTVLAGRVNAAGYNASNFAGVTCASGPTTALFSSVEGIVTHC